MAVKPSPISSGQIDRVQDAANAIEDALSASHVDQPGTSAPMADQAVLIAGTANTEAITDLIKSIGSEMDTTKAQLAVALLNVTNTAVQLQGRTQWNTRDFLSFGVALAALSHIDAS